MEMENFDLNAQSLQLFIDWVSHKYPTLAFEYVEKANRIIASGETVKFQKVLEMPALGDSLGEGSREDDKPMVIDKDTKLTSENYAVVLEYLANIYDGERYEIMKEVVEKRIVKDGDYFEVSFLEAISQDILNERIKAREQEKKRIEEERIRREKPEGIEERRALFAKAVLARIAPLES